jgi:hypothetical protein
LHEPAFLFIHHKEFAMPQQMSREMQQCMQDCAQCAMICEQTAHHCLEMGGEHASPDHQRVMRDCAEICALSVAFMTRISPHSIELCRLCATVCSECAQECQRMANGDRMMTQCAEICRRCAESCEQMAGAAV